MFGAPIHEIYSVQSHKTHKQKPILNFDVIYHTSSNVHSCTTSPLLTNIALETSTELFDYIKYNTDLSLQIQNVKSLEFIEISFKNII